jgi:hypothetical protein
MYTFGARCCSRKQAIACISPTHEYVSTPERAEGGAPMVPACADVTASVAMFRDGRQCLQRLRLRFATRAARSARREQYMQPWPGHTLLLAALSSACDCHTHCHHGSTATLPPALLWLRAHSLDHAGAVPRGCGRALDGQVWCFQQRSARAEGAGIGSFRSYFWLSLEWCAGCTCRWRQ